jgi:hypothetical protein
MKTAITLALVLAAALTAQAEPRSCSNSKERNPNYILRRQQAYQVQGPPTSRMIIGKREIDGYRDHRTGTTLWFEGDNVVGVTR